MTPFEKRADRRESDFTFAVRELREFEKKQIPSVPRSASATGRREPRLSLASRIESRGFDPYDSVRTRR